MHTVLGEAAVDDLAGLVERGGARLDEGADGHTAVAGRGEVVRVEREALGGLGLQLPGLAGHLAHGLAHRLAYVTPLGHRSGYALSCLDQCLSGS